MNHNFFFSNFDIYILIAFYFILLLFFFNSCILKVYIIHTYVYKCVYLNEYNCNCKRTYILYMYLYRNHRRLLLCFVFFFFLFLLQNILFSLYWIQRIKKQRAFFGGFCFVRFFVRVFVVVVGFSSLSLVFLF